MLVWDPQEGYDHVLNGVRHHFGSILQRKRKICYAVTALRRLFTLPCKVYSTVTLRTVSITLQYVPVM